MYNKKVLNKATANLDKAKAPVKKADIITDPMGQWKYPGQNTRIPGGNITMEGVPYPVMAQPNVGQPQMMYPGQDYQFPGADYVDEFPMARRGGAFPKLPNKKNSKAYSRSLTATNKLFAQNPLTKKNKSRKNKVFDPNAKYYQEGGPKDTIIYPPGDSEYINQPPLNYDILEMLNQKARREYEQYWKDQVDPTNLNRTSPAYQQKFRMKEGLVKAQDGGISLPKDYNQFINFTQTLPSNLQDPEYQYGNPDQYNLYGMWETVGKPQSFKDVQDSDYFPLQDDGEYHGFTVGSDGEFLKPMSHSTTWKEVMNSELNTDPYFKENRLIKNEQGRLQYVPNKQKGGFHTDINKRRQVLRDWVYGADIGMLQEANGGYLEAELTDEEIKEYRKGGYIIEDISVPQLTQAQEGSQQPIIDKSQDEAETFAYAKAADKERWKELMDDTRALMDTAQGRKLWYQDLKPKNFSIKELQRFTQGVKEYNKGAQDYERARRKAQEDKISGDDFARMYREKGWAKYDQATMKEGYKGQWQDAVDEANARKEANMVYTDEALEFTGAPALLRIAKDPMGTLEGVGNTAADIAMSAIPGGFGAALGAGDPNVNPLTGNQYWSGLDQTLDVAGVLPGIGALGKLGKVGKAGDLINDAGKFVTTKTPLKNAYKYNRWAFKPNPESYYRTGEGRKFIDDVLETNKIRAYNENSYANLRETGKISGIGEDGKIVLKAKTFPETDTYWSKGVPLDGRYASQKYGDYMIEASNDIPFIKAVNQRTKQQGFWDAPDVNYNATHTKGNYVKPRQSYGYNIEGNIQSSIGTPLEYNPELIKLYEPHWLKGYKEVFNKLPNTPKNILSDYKKGGYIDAELTPEEIDWYRSQGYQIEDMD